MIAHVAEASEASGRVVLWLEPSLAVSASAIDAAARVAAAYGSEVETVVVGSGDMPLDGSVPVRRIAVAGGRSESAPAGTDMPDALDLCVRRQQRLSERAAASFGVSCRHASVLGDPFDRLAEMCQARGPWNIIAVTQPASAGLGHVVSSILANVAGATGVIVAPVKTAPGRPRVSVIIEDMDRMPSMLRAAERLTGAVGQVHVLIAETTRAVYDELETAVRLLTEGRPGVVFESTYPTFGVEGALDSALRRAAPGFVVARFGGALLVSDKALGRTIALTGAPFLLVR